MMSSNRTTIYLDKKVKDDVKDYLVDSNEFKTMSEMITFLLKDYISKDRVSLQEEIDSMKKDLKSNNRNSKILLQQITTLLKKQDAVPSENYKESYFYKKSVDLIDEEFRNIKMKSTKIKDGAEEKSSLFKNIYG